MHFPELPVWQCQWGGGETSKWLALATPRRWQHCPRWWSSQPCALPTPLLPWCEGVPKDPWWSSSALSGASSPDNTGFLRVGCIQDDLPRSAQTEPACVRCTCVFPGLGTFPISASCMAFLSDWPTWSDLDSWYSKRSTVGNLLEIQNLEFHPRLSEYKSAFNRIPGDLHIKVSDT